MIDNLMNELPKEEFSNKEISMITTIFQTMNSLAWITDPEGRLLYCNHAFEEVSGYTLKELCGKKMLEFLIPQPELESVQSVLNQLSYEIRNVQFDSYWKTKNGSFSFISTSCTLFLDTFENIKYVIGTGHDITQKINIQKAIVDSEEQLRLAINSMPEIVCFRDAEGRWIRANDFTLKILKLEDVDYFGKTNSELAKITPTYSDSLLEFDLSDQAAWEYGGKFRSAESIVDGNGQVFTFDIMKIPLFYPDGSRKGIVTIGRDISEIIEVKEKMRTLLRDQKLILTSAGDGILGLDANGCCTFFNPAGASILGYRVEELIGKQFHPKVHYIKKDGTHYPTEECPIYSSIEKGIQQHISLDWFIKKDGTIFPVEYVSTPIINDKKIIGAVVIFKDITSRLETEDLLRKADKINLAAELAAGVGHEIRNPLTTLKGFLQLLRENKDNIAYCDIMLDEIDRLDFITSEFMSLAKPQAIKFKYNNIESIINHVIILLQSQANMRGIEIIFEKNLPLPNIYCEDHQIKQVLINLLKNSIEAQKNGQIHIKVDQVDGQVRIQISDQGCGLTEEQLTKVGEPFYSTKEKGTGLGLMVCYNIIKNHKGNIQISSQINVGTTVEINLPVENK